MVVIDEPLMLKRLLSAQWFAVAVVGGASFVLSVFIARRFGPELYGVYAQAVSFGALLAIIIDGGFGRLLMRETARASPLLQKYGASLHGYAFGYALMAIMLLELVALGNPTLHRPTILATVAAFGAAVLCNFSVAILRGHGRLVRDALWQICSRLITLLCMVSVLMCGADEPWEILAAQFFGTTVFLFLLMREGCVVPVFRIPKDIYKIALPLIWLDLATVVYFRSDMFLLKIMGVPLAQVGAYGISFRLVEAFLMFAAPVSLLLFRRFRVDCENVVELIVPKVVNLAVIAFGIGFSILLIALLTADFFFAWVFGEAFALAGDLFKVLCFMLLLALPNGVLGQAVFALGLDRFYLWTATFAAAFNVIGNAVLMPAYGVWAAVWMTVTTEAVLGIGLSAVLFIAWKKRYVEPVGVKSRDSLE